MPDWLIVALAVVVGVTIAVLIGLFALFIAETISFILETDRQVKRELERRRAERRMRGY